MPERLDVARLDRIVSSLLDRLEGEWLLIGGALVALWVERRRVTEDVDLVGLAGTQDERLALMQAAADLGLPIETVNSAADFFVRRVPGWREEIELFRDGPRARLYRPTPTLFCLLKLNRLSAQDLADCFAVIARARAEGLRLDRARVLDALRDLPAVTDGPLAERRRGLREALGTGA